MNFFRNASKESPSLRRRFFWLVVFIVTPIVVLAIIGARSIKFEAIAVREAAVNRAQDLAKQTGDRLFFLNFPGFNCTDENDRLPDFEKSKLLHPDKPEDDLVYRLLHGRAPDVAWAKPLEDYQFQACLLNDKAELVYPRPNGSVIENRSAEELAKGWSELQQAHEKSRELYQLFSQQRAGGKGDIEYVTQYGVKSEKAPKMFYFLQSGERWISWRLQLGDSGYQLFLALPIERFRSLAARVIDPSAPVNGIALVDPFLRTLPADYMELSVLTDREEAWIYSSSPKDAHWLKIVPGRWRRTDDMGFHLRAFMGDTILAQYSELHVSVGSAKIKWITEGSSKDSPLSPILIQVLVRDQAKMLAVVYRHMWWLGISVGLSVIGEMIALRAGWKAFRQQELLSEMKMNFLSSVSHELRTPIASIRLMAEGLQRGTISEPAKQAEYYRLILQESRRVSGLVENVLDVSRIERGRKQYSIEPCAVDKLFHATLDGLRPYAEDKKVHLESRVEGAPGPVDCDSIAIQQVLVNLIDNAIKHSPAGATVTVLLKFEDRSVRLSVSDVGPGIPAEDHEKIFEPFFRRGSELRRETQGTGLGLSIVRHAVEAHGGTIRVESEPGQGSRFALMLPTVGAKSHAAEVKP